MKVFHERVSFFYLQKFLATPLSAIAAIYAITPLSGIKSCNLYPAYLVAFLSAIPYYSLAGRDLEREIIPLAQDQQLSILPWSPLAGGLLSGKFQRHKDNPTGARRTTFDFPPVDLERTYNIMDILQPIAHSHDCSPARISLAWLLSRSYVTSVIIGAKSVEQLRDNLMAAELKLTDDELAAIDEVSRLPVEYPQWMLNYQAQERSPGGSRPAS